MTLIFISTKTTGFDPKYNSIIQLTGEIVSDSSSEQFSFNIKPYHQERISKEVALINNIDNTTAYSYPEQSIQYHNFINLLKKYELGSNYNKAYLIGYNSNQFEYPFMREWFAINFNLNFGYYFWYPSLDIQALAALYLIPSRSTMKDFKLNTIYSTICDKELDSNSPYYKVEQIKEVFYNLANKMLPKFE